MGLGNTEILFWLHYYYGIWDPENNSIVTQSPPKKRTIFVSDYSITNYYDAWDLKKMNLTGPSLKKLYFNF